MVLIVTDVPAQRERWQSAACRIAREQLTVTTLDELRQCLTAAPAAAVLLDLAWSGVQQAGGVESLLADFHSARVVACSPHCSDAEGEALVLVGVQGYLDVNSDAAQVSQALQHVLAGDMWLSRHLMEYVLRHYQQQNKHNGRLHHHHALAALTPRQQQVAMTVAQGMNNKSIARYLNISERTVKAHLSAIFERTGSQSRTELASLLGNGQPRKGRRAAG